jgi:hypothetical protein
LYSSALFLLSKIIISVYVFAHINQSLPSPKHSSYETAPSASSAFRTLSLSAPSSTFKPRAATAITAYPITSTSTSTPPSSAHTCNVSEIMPVLPDVDGGHEERSHAKGEAHDVICA